MFFAIYFAVFKEIIFISYVSANFTNEKQYRNSKVKAQTNSKVKTKTSYFGIRNLIFICKIQKRKSKRRKCNVNVKDENVLTLESIYCFSFVKLNDT